MTSDKSSPKGAPQSGGKRPYEAPSLTYFGTVRDLTQSGTGAWPEGAGMVGRGFPGMGGGGGMMTGPVMLSDRRCKTDIVRVADHPAGFGIYLYSYRHDAPKDARPGRWLGVMADEVREVVPEAVQRKTDGYDRVNYAGLGIHPQFG